MGQDVGAMVDRVLGRSRWLCSQFCPDNLIQPMRPARIKDMMAMERFHFWVCNRHGCWSG